ncbi:MAG: PD40 domain-containing protein [Bacteroidetes bacterium]|nr:PD40 domain-containing protein [Bacteroidota bacterium]
MILHKKNSFLFLCSLLLSLSVCFAQNENTGKKIQRKVLRYERKADIYFYNSDFQSAFSLYQQAYGMDTTNVQVSFKTGICLYNFKKYKQSSLPYFEKALRGGISDANYYLGNLHHLNGKFDEAIHSFVECKKKSDKKIFSDEEVDFLISKCKTAKEMIRTPLNVKIENIGNGINSEFPDYVPVISADESLLIFTSRRKGSTGNQLDPNGDYFEDVYVSHKKDSVWSVPKSISANINTPTHDACVGLSADGELLFLYRTSKDLLSGDLYFSSFNGKDWTVPEKFPSEINTTDYTEPSASISADGQVLYFSSNRPGGFGKKDIYKVVKLPNGEWSKAVNLGASVNTAEDEDSPFIHPDDKTLYFSSKAHKNMGGYDIFKTTFGEDGTWSAPQNLGYPINTPDDDIYFVLSVNGRTGYYSSARKSGYGSADIYMIHFPEEEDLGYSVYKGRVVSDSADAPLYAKGTLFDLENEKLEGLFHTNSNPLTGRFIMILLPGKEYKMIVEAEGYVSFSGKISSDVSQSINTIKLYKMRK